MPNRRRMGFLTAVILLGPGLSPRTGYAQSAAVLTAGQPADQVVDDEASRAAMEAVTGALSDEGVTVLRLEDTQTRLLAHENRECNHLACAGEIATTLGVDFTVLVTVYTRDGAPSTVAVTLIGQDSESYGGDGDVSDGDLGSAARAATSTAFGRWESSRMGHVTITTVPEGGLIEIDDRAVGTAPVSRLVEAGMRTVRASLGELRAEREVRVVAREETQIVLELGAASRQDEGDILNFILGGSFLTAGLAVAIPGFVNIGLDGTCETPGMEPGSCRSFYRFDAARDGTLIAVGSALLVTGVVFMAAQPIRVSVSASSADARFTVEGAF